MDRRLSPEELARQKRLAQLERELKKILLQSFTLSISITQIQNAIRNLNEQFSIMSNKDLLRKISIILKKQFSKFQITLINGITKEFDITRSDQWGNLKNRYSKTTKETELFDILRNRAIEQSRTTAAQSQNFYNEVKGGLKISDRIWKTFENIPKEIDVMVQNHIKEGKSAIDLAKELERNLNDSNRLYRRVKNSKTGKLEWSQAARQYNPGQGVYRSSFKNALRLARTEINRGYRQAEWNGYQNNMQIYGYEIVTSSNTQNQCDVCRSLSGVYPKWFLWTGWHPQCRCRMIPILMPQEDWKRLIKLRLEGKEDQFKYNFIKELPHQFVGYLLENKERIGSASSYPYWFEDNLQELQKIF